MTDPSQPATSARAERPTLFNLFSRKGREHNLREQVEALVSTAAHLNPVPGETPALDRQECALLMNVLHLRNVTAGDVMTPRADIVAMAHDITFDEALTLMQDEQHSRLPVYRKELDDVLGMVHVKDLVGALRQDKPFELAALLRQPLFIAATIPVLDLLLQMRQRRTHMALVIDEYGSIDGLVTIEDLIETIVGDISDEHDDPVVSPWRERPDGTVDIDPRMPVEDLEKRLGGAVLTPAEQDAEIETAGGLIFHLAEHVPARGEVLTHPSGLEFRVTDADARHIRALRMRKPEGWKPAGASPDRLEEDRSDNG
ncbi:HlyC/CorC family transporter [Formicincola oecophyllae]|uniref:HlyC/CorC family transporter n=1 Tax=Formicincola oecophyllae TaxID=2558361 RepID=A0A4Y6U6D1_9PROT|nr:hemolysin family protein [Formicincola oecophyllae]QDH12903.1 HlyC/CorC family transporter [Formicincola oecophyllae]